MSQLVFRGRGRKVIKRLSVDEKIIQLRQQLGETRQEAVRGLRWLEMTLEARRMAVAVR